MFLAETGDLRNWVIHDEWKESLDFDEIEYSIILSQMTAGKLLEEYDKLEPDGFIYIDQKLTLATIGRVHFCNLIEKTLTKIVTCDMILVKYLI